MSKILMIIAPTNFRDEELFEPKEEIEKAGHEVVIASKDAGDCSGALGGKATAALALSQVNTSDYDAVAFIGGMGCEVYFDDSDAHRIAKEMYAAGKVVSAICLAPVILLKAGLLAGKKVTVTPSESSTMTAGGAEYIGGGVVTDGKIITADGPASAREFGQKIAAVL